MTPIIRETDAIVLDTHDHGESDLILTLYCRENGRVTAIAKGAKKSKRRFVNKLELFSFIQVTLRQRNPNTLALLQEAELHSGFIRLRQDFTQYTAASVLREFTLFAIRDGEEDERFYKLLLWSLHMLNRGEPHLQIVMLFLLRFYDYIGYRPELRHCFSCGVTELAHSDFRFNTSTGSIICAKCARAAGQSGIPLSPGTIKMLQSCQHSSLERLHRVKVAEGSLYEALNILHRYGRHILQRDIISWKMLRKTLKTEPAEWNNYR